MKFSLPTFGAFSVVFSLHILMFSLILKMFNIGQEKACFILYLRSPVSGIVCYKRKLIYLDNSQIAIFNIKTFKKLNIAVVSNTKHLNSLFDAQSICKNVGSKKENKSSFSHEVNKSLFDIFCRLSHASGTVYEKDIK